MSRVPLRAKAASLIGRPTVRPYGLFRQYNDQVQVQRVRIRRPYFSSRRLATRLFYGTCGAAFFYYVMPISIEVEESNEKADDSEHLDKEKKDVEGVESLGDEDALFLPLGFAKRKPRQFYRSSDPEWQEFVALSRDQERHKRAQKELVALVKNAVKSNKAITSQLGSGEVKVGRYWLELLFPDGPPQEYEQTGIEIGDEYIAIATRDVSQTEYARMSRMLWPAAALKSTWASLQILCTLQYYRMMEALGIHNASNHELSRLKDRMEKLARATSKSSSAGLPPIPFPGRSSPHETGRPNSPGSIPPVAPNNDTQLTKQSPENHSPFTTIIPPSADVPIALHVFNATMAKSRRTTLEPPRGCCLITGLIEISGTRAKVTLDVKGAYDPAAGKYAGVAANMRTFKLFKQPPLGGP